jgi:hypothetical protein
MPSARVRLILIVAAIAALSPAPAAQAKGIAQATICGADGCTDITSRAQSPRGCAGCSAEQLLSAPPGSAHPQQRAPYVRLVLGFGAPGGEVQVRERLLWAPVLRLAARSDGRGGWAWFRPTAMALAVAHRLDRDIRPYPAASMPLAATAPTVTPARAPAAPPHPDDAGGPAPLLLGGAILAAGVVLAALAVRRRHRTA